MVWSFKLTNVLTQGTDGENSMEGIIYYATLTRGDVPIQGVGGLMSAVNAEIALILLQIARSSDIIQRGEP